MGCKEQIFHNSEGLYHRLDGPAVIHHDCSQEWYVNGLLHRTDGPAFICGDIEIWYQNGKRHRLDGPATCIKNRDSSYDNYRWYIDDIEYSMDMYLHVVRNFITEDEYLCLVLRYGRSRY